MLIVAGHFDIDPADRDAFLEARSPAMEATRNEGGYLEYVMSADPINPARVVLFERWDDQASLDAHMAVVASTPAAAGPPRRFLGQDLRHLRRTGIRLERRTPHGHQAVRISASHSGTTAQQFRTYWSDVHAPLLANDPDLARHVNRYELNPRLPPTPTDRVQHPRFRTLLGTASRCCGSTRWTSCALLGAEPGMAAVRESAKKFHQDEKLVVITEEPDTILPSPRREEAGAEDARHRASQRRQLPRHRRLPRALAEIPRLLLTIEHGT